MRKQRILFLSVLSTLHHKLGQLINIILYLLNISQDFYFLWRYFRVLSIFNITKVRSHINKELLSYQNYLVGKLNFPHRILIKSFTMTVKNLRPVQIGTRHLGIRVKPLSFHTNRSYRYISFHFFRWFLVIIHPHHMKFFLWVLCNLTLYIRERWWFLLYCWILCTSVWKKTLRIKWIISRGPSISSSIVFS